MCHVCVMHVGKCDICVHVLCRYMCLSTLLEATGGCGCLLYHSQSESHETLPLTGPGACSSNYNGGWQVLLVLHLCPTSLQFQVFVGTPAFSLGAGY